jgi:hypothetical protein
MQRTTMPRVEHVFATVKQSYAPSTSARADHAKIGAEHAQFFAIPDGASMDTVEEK